MEKTLTHSFNIELAVKFKSIEKAIIYGHLLFYLEAIKANGDKNENHSFKHTDGKTYYWTYMSSQAFRDLYPYLSPKSIARWLRELEKGEFIISNSFNKSKYDKTKWYTMPQFEVSNSQNTNSDTQNPKPIAQNEPSSVENDTPIPISISSSNSFSKPISDASPKKSPNKTKKLINYSEEYKQGSDSYNELKAWCDEYALNVHRKVMNDFELVNELGKMTEWVELNKVKHTNPLRFAKNWLEKTISKRIVSIPANSFSSTSRSRDIPDKDYYKSAEQLEDEAIEAELETAEILGNFTAKNDRRRGMAAISDLMQNRF